MNKATLVKHWKVIKEWAENEDAELFCTGCNVALDDVGFDGNSTGYEIRYKPQTILVNGIEVPAPVKPGTIKKGQIYHYPVLYSNLVETSVWGNLCARDEVLMSMGLIYLDSESAKKRAEAMLKFV